MFLSALLIRYPVTINRSPLASLQIKGLANKYTTVKWPIGEEPPYMIRKCVMYCQTTEKLDIA